MNSPNMDKNIIIGEMVLNKMNKDIDRFNEKSVNYLSQAIYTTIKNNCSIKNIVLDIYMPIANIYNTSISNVESSIRYIRNMVLSSDNNDIKNIIFVHKNIDTNSEFIIHIAMFIKKYLL